MFRRLLAGVLAAGSLTAAVVATAPAANAACSDVDVSFARGTGESPGLGLAGTPFTNSLKSALGAKTLTVYAVNYAASSDQSSAGPGSKDLVAHLSSVAASCPNTVFVIGGYSQGATVVTNAVGIRTSSSANGAVIPAALAPKVKAVVAFGNPLGLQRQTIETASATYGSRAKSYCNSGDPVCGGGFNVAAHLAYGSNGMAADGGRFAAGKVG